jgi:DNA polymerase-3 subunit delta
VKLSGSRIGAFLRAPDPKLRLVLIHGSDRGLVRERAANLARTVVDDLGDAFRVTELTVEDVRSDGARIADELSQISFLGGRRVVFVRMDGEDISARLQHILDTPPPGDALLIVEAGELSARSPVRKAFEASSNAVAIPCYGDDDQNVGALIDATFAEAAMSVDRAAREFLVAHLGSDRMVTRSELDKLALYALGQQRITLDDAIAAVGDSGALSLDDIAFAAGEGNGPALDKNMERALREGEGPIAILRATLRHFHRLHLALGHMQQGRSPDDAMKALRPPVIFLHEDNFRRQLRLWNVDRARAALALISEAERDCKSTGVPDEAVCHRALMRICLAARRAR